MRAEHLDPGNPDETLIRVEGLQEEVVLLHLTDCHLALADERDPGAGEEVARSQAVFRQYTPGQVAPEEVFAAALAQVREKEADGLVLSGDILQFPTRAGVKALEQVLGDVGIPSVYALGNHDWYFPYLEWNPRTRQEYYPRFHRLTGGDPACQARLVKGVRLVALDNSTYQVGPAQVAFLREQLRMGQPWVLSMHIPLYLPGLAPAVVERWQAPIMMGAPGWTPAGRARWRTWEDEPGTRECCRLLGGDEAENLVGIFCGHVHFAHADALGRGAFQYTTRAGFEGGYRIVRLMPWN